MLSRISGVRYQRFHQGPKEVVEFIPANGALAFRVTLPQLFDLRRQRSERVVLFLEYLRYRFFRVDGQREDISQHVSLRKARRFEVDFRLLEAGRDQVPLIFAVEDGE